MPDAWERQHREPPKAYHAFAHYRDLGPLRSIDKAWDLHARECLRDQPRAKRRSPKAWRAMSAFWGWVGRAQQWDAEIDRQMREKTAKQQLDAKERHVRLAQGALTALTVPVRATLEALQDPRLMTSLGERVRSDPNTLLTVVQIVARCAHAIPGLVSTERLALGLTTDFITIGETKPHDFADKIGTDPEATDLAIKLLDRLSRADDPDPTTH